LDNKIMIVDDKQDVLMVVAILMDYTTIEAKEKM
jgi:hypothetical protein